MNYLKKHVGLVVALVALIIALINYLIFPLFIKKQMNIINVPISIKTINETTKITDKDVVVIEMTKEYLPKGIILNKDDIVGKYVKNDCTIPTNGFFYKELITTEEITMGKIFRELRDNEIAYNLNVDPQWVQNDNIHINQFINVYVHFTYKDIKGGQNYIFGQLAENVRVIGISEDSTIITIALSEEEIAYFNLAYLLEDSNIAFVPTTYFNSNGAIDYNTKYYDINATKEYIRNNSTILNIVNIDEPAESIEISENE